MLALHVVEGEKCADALWEVGLVATTSQGGSGRAEESDWTPAAAFGRIFIWQDIDRTNPESGINPGIKYAETVARLIGAAAAIRIVELEGYWGASDANFGRDVYDLIAEFREDGKENEEIAAGLLAIAEQYNRLPGTPAALLLAEGNKFKRKGAESAKNSEEAGNGQTENRGGAEATDSELHAHAASSAGDVSGCVPSNGGGWEGASTSVGGMGNLSNTAGHGSARNQLAANNAILTPQDYQPKPMGADPVGRAGRLGKELANWEGAEGKTVDEIYEQLVSVTDGWPCRVRSPGAKHPLLFIDYGSEQMPKNLPKSASAEKFKDLFETHSRFSELLPGPLMPDRIRWIGAGDNFKCWLHERTRLKFREKLDVAGANYVSVNDLYQYCGNARAPEYKAVECRPHWPPLPGHYYAWELRGKYTPDGSALRGLLEYFNNCKDGISRVVALAAIMTPGWGAPYGKKPMIVFQAPDRGCGKTTLAECISKVWNGHLSIDLSGRDQDELVQRLLTPEALTKRIGILDNVKGTLSSAMLEWLVTTQLISGKRLYSGDASRPNTINYFITMNGPSCSPDVALRSYFVELQKPTYSAQWDERLADYVAARGCDVVADVGMLMCSPVKRAPSVVDRWPLWGREVLARAADFIGEDVDAVMQRTRELRDECDDEQDECNELMAGLLRLVSGAEGCGSGDKAWRHSRSLITHEFDSYSQSRQTRVAEGARGAVFVSSTEMAEIWREVLGGKLRPRQIWKVLGNYLGAGKLPHLGVARCSASNGYEIAEAEMNRYLDEYRNSLPGKDKECAQTTLC